MAEKRCPNPVEAAIKELGGIYAACAATGLTPTTMYKAQKDGMIRGAAACLRLAKALKIPVDPRLKRLAGLKEE